MAGAAAAVGAGAPVDAAPRIARRRGRGAGAPPQPDGHAAVPPERNERAFRCGSATIARGATGSVGDRTGRGRRRRRRAADPHRWECTDDDDNQADCADPDGAHTSTTSAHKHAAPRRSIRIR